MISIAEAALTCAVWVGLGILLCRALDALLDRMADRRNLRKARP